MCLFCAKKSIGPRHTSAMSIELRETILKHCKASGPNDEWGLDVKGRLQSCCDLTAEESVYHRLCYLKFVTNRTLDSERAEKVTGCPVDDELLQAFSNLC